jgi:hypothetical protein
MTETSGMDVAAGMSGEALPAVVFVTAHERYAREAFDVRALDYLLKPFEEERFRTALDRVRGYIGAIRSRRSHEHLVAILRTLSDTPVEELERLRAPEMPLRFADLELDPATRDVRRAGRPVALRPKEYGGLGLSRRREQPDGGHPRRGAAAEARPRAGGARVHPDGGEDGVSPAVDVELLDRLTLVGLSEIVPHPTFLLLTRTPP